MVKIFLERPKRFTFQVKLSQSLFALSSISNKFEIKVNL